MPTIENGEHDIRGQCVIAVTPKIVPKVNSHQPLSDVQMAMLQGGAFSRLSYMQVYGNTCTGIFNSLIIL